MKIYIQIDVPDDFEACLSMQAVIEQEITADRWSWHKEIPIRNDAVNTNETN